MTVQYIYFDISATLVHNTYSLFSNVSLDLRLWWHVKKKCDGREPEKCNGRCEGGQLRNAKLEQLY